MSNNEVEADVILLLLDGLWKINENLLRRTCKSKHPAGRIRSTGWMFSFQ